MPIVPRREQFAKLLGNLPPYRLTQINEALFDPRNTGWADATSLPKLLRETLTRETPWITLVAVATLESKKKDTVKAVLETQDKKRIETVLMKNARGHWSICVSSQVGCAMNCSFCATGKMGFTRNLTSDEIIDQYRFWIYFFHSRSSSPARGEVSRLRDGGVGDKAVRQTFASPAPERITNIVYMGMGEPLANYENVKSSLNTILSYTDIGPTRITVSTVGILPQMQKILTDSDWPPVKIAVSLHSADPAIRKQIVPSTSQGFLDSLAEWMRQAHARNDARRNHITFEYILIENVNDRESDAKKLIHFSRKSRVPIKINLIPYNKTLGNPFTRSELARQHTFKSTLERSGIIATIRRTMGDDISAACGQLVTEESQREKAQATRKN